MNMEQWLRANKMGYMLPKNNRELVTIAAKSLEDLKPDAILDKDNPNLVAAGAAINLILSRKKEPLGPQN